MSGIRVDVPVVPGDVVPLAAEKCAACGTGGQVRRYRIVIDGIDMVLCLDAVRCAVWYRGLTSPETYAAGLRGEILAITP